MPRRRVVAAGSEERVALVEQQDRALSARPGEDLGQVALRLADPLRQESRDVGRDERPAELASDGLGAERLARARLAVEERRDPEAAVLLAAEAPRLEHRAAGAGGVRELLDRCGEGDWEDDVVQTDRGDGRAGASLVASVVSRRAFEIGLRDGRAGDPSGALDGRGGGDEDRVLDEATREVEAVRERAHVDVGGERQLGGQVLLPDDAPSGVVGRLKRDVHEDAPAERGVEVVGEVRGQDRDPLEALELAEQHRHQGVALSAVAEDDLALVEEEERTSVAGRSEERWEEAVRLMVLSEGRHVDVEDRQAHSVGDRVGRERLPRAWRAMEQEDGTSTVTHDPVEPPDAPRLHPLRVVVHDGLNTAAVGVRQHHLFEGGPRRLDRAEGGQLVFEVGLANEEPERREGEDDLETEQLLWLVTPRVAADIDELGGDQRAIGRETPTGRNPVGRRDLGKGEDAVDRQSIERPNRVEATIERLELCREARPHREEQDGAFEVAEPVASHQKVEAELEASGVTVAGDALVDLPTQPRFDLTPPFVLASRFDRPDGVGVEVEVAWKLAGELRGHGASSQPAEDDTPSARADPKQLVLEVGEVGRVGHERREMGARRGDAARGGDGGDDRELGTTSGHETLQELAAPDMDAWPHTPRRESRIDRTRPPASQTSVGAAPR